MKVSRKRSLRKNLTSRNRRNKTRGRKIQYGGNLNRQQIHVIERIMKSLKFSKREIIGYIKNFNSVSTLLDPEFNEYIEGFEELLEEAEKGDGGLYGYRRILARSTKNGNPLSSKLIEDAIILEKQETFRNFFDGVLLGLEQETESRDNLTDEERD